MTQEEKQLLIKDLCTRLPHGVMYDNKPEQPKKLLPISPYKIEDIKPYLRPMSSMTEEERKEYNKYLFHGASIGLMSNTETAYELIDWLNSHYFDYRGLIEKGLALEAPNDMYKNE